MSIFPTISPKGKTDKINDSQWVLYMWGLYMSLDAGRCQDHILGKGATVTHLGRGAPQAETGGRVTVHASFAVGCNFET